ncbi:MAG: ABC transporter permease subunit, partial [Candidatus Micrarchaeota archaeon]
MTYGAKHYELPGIGYYLAKSVFIHGNIPAAMFGLLIFAGMVYAMNQLVWKPLGAYANRFKCQTMESTLIPCEETPAVRFIEWLARKRVHVDNAIEWAQGRWNGESRRISRYLDRIYIPRPRMHVKVPFWKQFSIYSLLFALVFGATALFVAYSLQRPVMDLKAAMDAHPEAYLLPEYAVFSVIRIFIAYVLALAWTLAAAIIVTRSKKLSNIFFPLFDIGQSIPALALFPFLIVIVIRFFGGGGLGLELASIILLMTGTQWYLLLNIIGAIRAIPGDVVEAARSFGIRDFNFVRHVLLPAIFPGLVLGSIQAWGGAWNASIVSEYVMYGRALDVNLTYGNVEITGARATLDGAGTDLQCAQGICSGSIVAEKTGNSTLSISTSAVDGSVSTASVAFIALEDNGKGERGAPVSFALAGGSVAVVSPGEGERAPLRPNVYSVKGLGYFLDKATAEWGNPSLVALTIATMSLTIILLNRFVWARLFNLAERYKFEMT